MAPDRAGIVLHPITAQVGGRTRVIGAVRLRAMAGEPRASALLPAVVQLAANALEGGRLEVARRTSDEDATRAGRRLAIISRLALELVGGRTIDGVSATLLGLAVDDLGAGFATVHVTDESSGEYHLTGSRGVPAGLSASLRTIAADAPSPVTRAAASRERVEIDGEDGWREAFPRTSNIPAITGVRAITAMPMVAGGRAHGVLTIGWRTAADRTAADHGMLAAAAAQGAQALERAILHAHDEDARRFQEAFIGVVSHELRTPITTIVAGSRLLKRRLTGNAAAEELTDDIEVEADRLTRIVDDLLVLSRLERRHLTIGDDPVHLDHLLARVVRSEETRWPTHTIVLPSSPNRHVVLGDETYVEQVLRNLISNAAKYSPSGSTIRVTIEDLANGDVEVRVLDEGSGISPAEVEDLFSLFYRSPSTAASAAGAGIGLFVSRQLVTEMGGRMWARPRPEGGSEFGLSLSSFPIDEPEALDDEDPEPSPATAGVD
jgi:signal transduction histidine kinase